MANEYYDHNSYPATGVNGSSAALRAELDTIESGFDKLPALTGNANKLAKVNATGTAQTVSRITDDGSTAAVSGDTITTNTATQTLTNKTIAIGSNTVSGTTAQFNTALTDGDFATLTGTETLTNKTLTGSAFNGTVGATTPSTGAFTTLSATVESSSASLKATNGTVTGYVIPLPYGGWGGGINTANALNVGTTTNHPIVFGTNNLGQAIIDASGNLGLGVTPSAWYTSKKALSVNSGASFAGSSAGFAEVYGNCYLDGSAVMRYSGNGYATVYQSGNNGTALNAWWIGPNNVSGAGVAATLTQAMTLDASGNLLVGFTNVAATTGNGVYITPGPGYGANAFINHASGAASGNQFLSFGYAGTGIGSITQNGTTAVAFNTTSDHRLKENVRPANAARFMDIEFVDFEWVDGRHDCGVIAHQLQSVYPDLVLGEKDATETRQVELTPAIPAVLDEEGNEVTPAVEATYEDQVFPKYQQVNYIGLIGRMGTTIQKQQRMLEAMEARLAALEAA